MASKKKKAAIADDKEKNNNNNNNKDKAKKKKKSKKRAKVESDDKSKEQRRKILEFRRMQSRFVLPPLAEINEAEAMAISSPRDEPDDNGDSTADDAKLDSEENAANTEQQEDEEEKEVQFVELPESQDDAINNLQIDFEEYDDDYFGFIEYDSFLRILKANKVNLSDKQETFLISSLTLIDEGVDYYGFLQILRNRAAKAPNDNLTKICQQIAIDAEKKANVRLC